MQSNHTEFYNRVALLRQKAFWLLRKAEILNLSVAKNGSTE